MHNGNAEWKVFTRHINLRREWKSCAHERRWSKQRRRAKMWRRWALKNASAINRLSVLAFIAHSLFIHFFSGYLHSFPHLFPCFLFYLSPLTLHPFLTHSVFSKSYFLSHHLSAWLERPVLTVFIIPLSDFIWSRGLDSELGCSCSKSCQTYHTCW